MASTTLTRNTLWTIDARVLGYAAIGAALYGVLGLVSSPLPGTDVAIRPAFALVTFFGYSFGPVVGLLVGFVGQSVLAQVSGTDVSAYWMRSVESGLVGLVAGLAALYAPRWTRGPLRDRAIGGAIAGVVGSLIGYLFVFVSIVTAQASLGTVLTQEYLPLAIGAALASAILAPILVYAWDPLSESIAG
jgi:energy-coupling factor transport system substrate-specific component